MQTTMALGLCYYRNLVARCYREIRYLGTNGRYEPLQEYYESCSKKLRYQDGNNGRKWVNPVFDQVRAETNVEKIEKVFAERVSGLTLEKLLEAFEKGNWGNNIGGSRWANITKATIMLRDRLKNGDEQQIKELTDQVTEMRHNTRRVVEDFIEPCK